MDTSWNMAPERRTEPGGDEYFVFYAPRGVSCELYIFIGVERVNRLNQPYSAHRNEVLDVHARVVELAGDINHKPKIAFYKGVFRARLSLS